jgi:hypothetical protein
MNNKHNSITKTRLCFYRIGSEVGLARELKVFIDGKEKCEVYYNKMVEVEVGEGEHELFVQMDWIESPRLHLTCNGGETIHITCGARTFLGFTFASVFTPKKTFFIERVEKPPPKK